jgi:hypothetical protein
VFDLFGVCVEELDKVDNFPTLESRMLWRCPGFRPGVEMTRVPHCHQSDDGDVSSGCIVENAGLSGGYAGST